MFRLLVVLGSLGAARHASAQSCDDAAAPNLGVAGAVLVLDDPAVEPVVVGCDVAEIASYLDGDELVFTLYLPATGETWSTGPGDRNPDGRVHAAIEDLGDGTFRIGFEDAWGGGDLDFDDANVVVAADGEAVALFEAGAPSPGIAGRTNRLSTRGATPQGAVAFWWGSGPGTTPVPECPGVTVAVGQARRAGVARADAAGNAKLDVFAPLALTNAKLTIQAVDLATCEASAPLYTTLE